MKNWVKLILFSILMAIAMFLLTGFLRHEICYVTETYTVTKSDTLQGIAERFIVKNTGTVRQIDEFREGIRELNYSVIGDDDDVKSGEILQIGYWED